MLPKEEWLHLAKQLCVGESKRIYHGAETRPNMLIQNTPTAYKAWCWHCNTGAIQHKQYSQRDVPISTTQRNYSYISIAKLAAQHSSIYKDLIVFLQTKGVSLVLLQPYILGFDTLSNRLVLRCGTRSNAAVLGRAIYPGSTAKWLTYNKGISLYDCQSNLIVVVEDNFSAIKVHHVMQCNTMALNGTRLSAEATLHLLDKDVYLHLDADTAGQRGALRIKQQLAALNLPCTVIHAPEPKELNHKQLRHLYGHLFTTTMPNP